MEFEKDGIIFSNEYIPPNIKPFPKIQNPAQFLKNWDKLAKKAPYILIERKYDGTNLRLVKFNNKIYVLTRNQNAENRFFTLFKQALENNNALMYSISQFFTDYVDRSYLVGELIAKELKAPYTSQFQPANFIIYELWDAEEKAFKPYYYEDLNFVSVEFRSLYYNNVISKKLFENLAKLAWLRDYEGFVCKALDGLYRIIDRCKVKPIHFNYPTHEGQMIKNETKKGKKRNKAYATHEQVLEAIHKVKLRLSEKEFIDPKIAMKEIAKEVKEEYGKALPTSAYRLYLQVVNSEL